MTDRADRLSAALSLMDVAVFVCSPDGHLQSIADPPRWFVQAWGEPSGPSTVDWLARSDFLTQFLHDADEFWERGTQGRLASGPWSESTLDHGLTQFEASAVLADGERWLLVERLGARHELRRGKLQAARERNLFLEQLLAAHEDRFILLDCIVHDLAGPLQGIRGCVEMLQRLDDGEQTREWTERALRQVQKQETLIEDVLRFFGAGTRGEAAEAAQLPVADAAVCAADVVDSLAPAAEVHGKALVLSDDVDPAQSFEVAAPAVELERVIGNLVVNAIRVTPPRSTVVVGVRRDGPDIVVTVDDQGPGVPSALRQTVFDRGSRAANAGRAGLGLYFARRAVETWGGVIGHFSLGESGSRFWFRLPRFAGRHSQGGREGLPSAGRGA